jgi:hypothetical protein
MIDDDGHAPSLIQIQITYLLFPHEAASYLCRVLALHSRRVQTLLSQGPGSCVNSASACLCPDSTEYYMLWDVQTGPRDAAIRAGSAGA